MNRRAKSAYLRNDFAQWPWFQSQLDLPQLRRQQFQVSPVRGGPGKKIGNNIFQTGQIQHLHIEFRNLKPNGGAAMVK
jgi:hypothetical protein